VTHNTHLRITTQLQSVTVEKRPVFLQNASDNPTCERFLHCRRCCKSRTSDN